MTRKDALGKIRQAKSAHIRWRTHVQAMLAGVDIESARAPLHHRECEFGQWFYQDGFKAFGHWPIFQDVEYAHELLHMVYGRVHETLKAGDQELAGKLAMYLAGISQGLLDSLDLLQEEIHNSEPGSF